MVKEVNKKYMLLLLTGIVLAISTFSFAQVNGTIGYSAFSDDNPQRTSTGESEFVNSCNADLSYRMLEHELYLNYSGAYSDFRTINDMSFQLHSFGLSYAFNTTEDDEEGNENVYSSLSYSLKKGTGEFAAYDYSQFTGFLNGKFPLGQSFFFRGAFYSSYKEFPDLGELTHFENVFSAQLSKFFNTGTGIFFESSLGFMSYSFLEESSGSFYGKGKGNRVTANNISFNVTQLRSGIRISQSITDNTGISARYLHRDNLIDNKGMYISSAYVYSGDEELWDDPYGFSGNDYGVELTQNFPLDIVLKLSAEYSSRNYTNNAADSLNLAQRNDERTGYWAGISKTFYELPLISSFEVTLEYMFVNNISGEPVFGYKNNLFMLGIKAGF